MRRPEWRKHRTASAIIKAYVKDLAQLGSEVVSTSSKPREFTKEIESRGMWAYVVVGAVPVVHYWAAPSQSEDQIAFMLGHELGHVTGKPYKNAGMEEDRADLFGSVAAEVVRRLRK